MSHEKRILLAGLRDCRREDGAQRLSVELHHYQPARAGDKRGQSSRERLTRASGRVLPWAKPAGRRLIGKTPRNLWGSTWASGSCASTLMLGGEREAEGRRRRLDREQGARASGGWGQRACPFAYPGPAREEAAWSTLPGCGRSWRPRRVPTLAGARRPADPPSSRSRPCLPPLSRSLGRAGRRRRRYSWFRQASGVHRIRSRQRSLVLGLALLARALRRVGLEAAAVDDRSRGGAAPEGSCRPRRGRWLDRRRGHG